MYTPLNRMLKVVLGAAFLWCVVGATMVWTTPTEDPGQSQAVENFRQAKSPAGSDINHTLAFNPITSYGHLTTQGLTKRFKGLVAGSGFRASSNLSLAAHEVGRFYRAHRRLAPSDVLSFILDSSGATYWGVQQTALVTTDRSDRVIRSLIEEQSSPNNRGWDIGVSDWSSPDARGVRVIVVLIAERTLRLESFPRQLARGESKVLKGSLAPGYRDPYVLAMNPAGEIRELNVDTNGKNFQVGLSGNQGPWVIEIMATGPAGPIPLSQLTLHFDEAVPDKLASQWPQDETHVADREEYLLGLINASRARHGLNSLTRVSALDAVANGHSKDMAQNQFVGHFSSQTGTLTQRMSRVDHPHTIYGENVALNTTIFDAHLGLMNSLGHRRNLLSPDFTEIGLSIVRGTSGWYVTEVFNNPGIQVKTARVAEPSGDELHAVATSIAIPGSNDMAHLLPGIR